MLRPPNYSSRHLFLMSLFSNSESDLPRLPQAGEEAPSMSPANKRQGEELGDWSLLPPVNWIALGATEVERGPHTSCLPSPFLA